MRLDPGETRELTAEIPVLASPQKNHWYSADLHHHSDVLDGFTPPAYVFRSELAAGIDIAFLSDHDSMVNNREMQRLSKNRGMEFISGTEMSPSWAHFNAYPLADDKTIAIDIGSAPVQAIFAEARRLGADIVHVNHPYGDYGYFRSLEREVVRNGVAGSAVPGGYADGFDVVEITAGDNRATLRRTWQLWNAGHRAYLAGGSDVHDVWNEESGAARTFVYVEGELGVDSFVTALKAGHAFASQGPLVFPEIMFGSEIQHSAGTGLELAYAIQAVAGLRSVRLIERGQELALKTFGGVEKPIQASFTTKPESDTWYSLVVEDQRGKRAYTNPVWVTVAE